MLLKTSHLSIHSSPIHKQGKQAEATAQQARAEEPGKQARRALADLLGKCTELEKLLGLRDRQLANLVLNALAERQAK